MISQMPKTKEQKRTAAGICWWSPTQLLKRKYKTPCELSSRNTAVGRTSRLAQESTTDEMYQKTLQFHQVKIL